MKIDDWPEAFIYLLAMWKCIDIIIWLEKFKGSLKRTGKGV